MSGDFRAKVIADTAQAESDIDRLIKKYEGKKVKLNVDAGNSKGAFKDINTSIQSARKTTKSFGDTLKRSLNIGSAVAITSKGIRTIQAAARDAVKAVKDIDSAITDLRMATGDSYSEVQKLVKSYNRLGQAMGANTTEVTNSANAWLRQGYTIKETNALIEDSMVLSKVSQLDSADATKYLTSAMKGYKVAVEDVSGIVDKLTAVDLVSATDAGGLAEAMSRTAVTAGDAGVSMDKLVGYLATVGEVTQKSMSSIGESFKTIFTRMHDIKANKLELVDEDGTTELLSDVELTLKNVGIDLRATVTEFNNAGDVLDSLHDKWNTLNSVQQAAVSKAFAGTRQAENFRVLMENYDSAKQYMDTAMNSAGKAEQKFAAYADSIEAKTKSLQAAFEALSVNSFSTEMFGGVIEASTAVLQFLDNTNLLKGALSGLVAAGAVKGFTVLATGIATATMNLNKFNVALKMIKMGNLGTDEIRKLSVLTANLSQSQLKAVLSSKALSTQQRMAILTSQGMSQAEAQAALATMALSAAEGTATATTFSLTGAIKGLWATLMANPLILVAAGVTAIVSAYSTYKRSVEEMISTAREEANVWKESNTSLQSHIAKVTELKEQLEAGNLTEEESYNVKSQLLDIQNQLIDTYGEQASGIDLVNGSLETQIGLIKQLSEEEAKKYLNENKQGIDEATKQMEKDRSYKLGIYQDDNGKRLKEVKEVLKNNKLSSDLFDDGSIRISFDGTAPDAYEALSSFASDLREIENKYGESEGIEILLNKLEGKINDAKGVLDDYQDIYQTAKLSELSTDNTKVNTSYDGKKSYSDVAKDYTDAISDYNEALLNIDDTEALDKAEPKFNAVQAAVDQIVAAVPGYATVFEELHGELNEAAVKTVSLNNALEDGSTNGLKSYADKIKELGLNDKEFVASLNDADSTTGKLSTSLVDAAQSAGLIGDSDAEVKRLVDALINAGIIAGQVSGEVQEAFNLDAAPLLDAYDAATESANEGDNYLKFAEALKKAKEAYNEGLVGTDDFKTAAAMFSPTGMDDAANFEENYNRIKKYFDADSAKGVQAFLKDLEALDKGYAEFDKSTGTWTTNFDDLEQAAKDMGMGFEPFMSVLKRMDDYGASNNFFSTTEEGMEHLTGLYSELAEEEMKLAQLKQTDPNNQPAIDATQDKIDILKSSIQESIGYLEQLTNMQAKDFDTQVTGAKEAYSALKEQQAKVLSEGGVNAQSVSDMIQDQLDTLAGKYHLDIDAKGNLVTVEQPKETPEVKVKADIEIPTEVDLMNRPKVSPEVMRNNGWDVEDGGYATVFSSSYSNEDGTKTVVVTPILPNGDVLDPSGLEYYANQLLEGKEIDANIKLGMFDGEDSIQKSNDYAEALHLVQEAYYSNDNALQQLLSSIKEYNSEQLRNIDFEDDKISDEEKEVRGLLDALGLTTNQAEALIQVLEQMGLVELPDIPNLSNWQKERAINLGWKPVMTESPEEYLSENPIEIPGEITVKNPEQLQEEASKNPLRLPVIPEMQHTPHNTDAKSVQTPATTTVSVIVDADNIKANAKVQETVYNANNSTGTVKIDGDNQSAKTKTNEATNYIDSQTGYINIESKDNLSTNIQNTLNAQTFKINVNANVSGLPKEKRANGTPFIKSATFNDGYFGHAFASGGRVGEPRDTIALTGELGEEMIVRGDHFFTVGENGAEMAHLKKGDIVFNAEQTKDLLSRGRINGRGRALAKGNARAGVGTNSLTFQGGAAGNKLGDDKSDKNNTKEKDKNTKAVKRSTQVFDWVATRLEYFANKTKKIADTITDYVSNVFKKAQLNKQMTAINREITANKKGAKAYLKKANSVAKSYTYYDDNGGRHSVSVPEKYKKLVQQGKWSIEDMDTSTDRKKALAEAIQSYQDYYQKNLECKQAVIDLRNEQLELYEDWANIPTDTAEKKIEKLDSTLKQLERDYTKLGGYDVSAMNDNLDKQTQNAEKQMKAYQKALKQANKNEATAERRFDQKQDAFSKKDRKALSKSQRNALKNGTEISTDGIKDTKLLNKVNAYNQALQKRTIAENAQREALDNATDAEKEYIETLQSNAQAKFDNVEKMFKNRLSEIEHSRNLLDAQINRTETLGHLVSKRYYEALRNTESSNLAELQKERDGLVASLNEAMASGAVKEGSEAWYDMQGQINDVTLSIEDATTAMIEYGNSIRDIDWKIFDLLQERISFVSDEAEFLISLMEDEKLYEDSGQLTDKGMSTMGLHGLNYNVAMAQADKYAEKVKKLNEELEKDPYDQDVINKRNEYLEQQQEMILSAENEKQAIVSLVKDGIEMELDALKELIEKREEALDSEKSLFDYQKGVKKQAEEIASLEKQLSAYAGDTSEESRSKIQQIKVKLEDARENLQETEYDHYISDQKKLLDDLYSEYEDILNKRLEDVDTLVRDMITKINENGKKISETISESSGAVGFTLSEQMLSIWKTGDGSISSILTTYSNSFNTALTTTNTTLSNIYTDIQKMVTYLDNQAKTNTDENTGDTGNNGQNGNAGTAPSSTVQQATQQIAQAVQNAVNGSSFNSNSINSGSGISGGNGVLHLPGDSVIEGVATGSGSLKKAKNLISKLKSKKLTDKELKKHSSLFQYIYKKSKNKNITNDKILELGNLLHVDGLPKKADKLTSANKKAVLDKLKEVGYKNGTRAVPRDMYAWTQEGGQEVIIRRSDGAILTPVSKGNMILNPDATSNLYDFMNNPAKFVNGFAPSVPMPTNKSVQESYKVDFGDIHLNFPNVKNYEEMLYALKHDKRFEDTVQSMTTGRLFGGSALRKYK